MGEMYVEGFFEAGLDFDSVLHVHMRSNCYPPINPIFTESFREAINLVANGEGNKELELPNGFIKRAYDIVDEAHLWSFVYHINSEEE